MLNIFKVPGLNILAMTTTFYYFAGFHIFAGYVNNKILKIYPKTAVKIDRASIILVGSAAFIAGTRELIDYIVGNESLTLTNANTDVIFVIAGIVLICGIAIMLVNTLKWGDYIFFIPVPVHVIMVYNDGGLLIYHRQVSPTLGGQGLDEREYLIPSALSAFSTFFQEILGSNEVLTHVSTQSYEFFFSKLPRDKGTIVVIASGSNFYLNIRYVIRDQIIPRMLLRLCSNPPPLLIRGGSSAALLLRPTKWEQA
jgi:hypothetical protein